MEVERLEFSLRSAIHQCDLGQVNPFIPHLQKVNNNMYVKGSFRGHIDTNIFDATIYLINIYSFLYYWQDPKSKNTQLKHLHRLSSS